MRRMIAGLVLCAVVGAGVPARAADDLGYGPQMGWGLLAFGTSLVYTPVKVCYAILGGLSGGLAYAVTLGDLDTASGVWSPTVGGTYILSPGMVRGDDPIYFIGESYDSGKR